MRKNRPFLCRPARRRIGGMQVGKIEKCPSPAAWEKSEVKSEFKEFSIFFPEHGEKRNQVGIQRKSEKYADFFRGIGSRYHNKNMPTFGRSWPAARL